MTISTQIQPNVMEKTKEKTRYAPRWQVMGLDDDVTPMDYVMVMLMEIFHKSAEEAYRLMMEVHTSGAASWYIGTLEACELKVEQVQSMNKTYDERLQVSIEVFDD
jgi:ATP-dependent Clp protease adaptor protein ClpS